MNEFENENFSNQASDENTAIAEAGKTGSLSYKTPVSTKKDRIFNWLRIFISIALLALIMFKNLENFGKIRFALLNINYLLVILSILLYVFMLWVESLRWDVLLRAQGVRIHRAYLFHVMYIGFFYNNILPSDIGGDFFRIYDICKNKKAPADKSASSVFLERFFGLISIIIFFAATSFSIYRLLKNYVILITVFLVMAVIMFILLAKPGLFKIDRIFKKFRKLQGIWIKIQSFSDAVMSYRKKIPQLILGLILNLVCQLIYTFIFYFVSKALELNIGISTFAFMVPVTYVLSGIPISIGGLGVRENTIVFLLVSFGVLNEKAVVFSVIILFIHIANGAIGGLIYLLRNLFFRTRGFI
jgi:uncharacterized protein (TIRG00374 family)